MGRPSKKAVAAAAAEAEQQQQLQQQQQQQPTTIQINVESFRRTRDSVVTGLAILQDAIQTMSSDYIKHTNAVLGESAGNLELDTALARLGNIGDNQLLGGALNALRAASPAKSVVGDKKEKTKRKHDLNAPKRPLTPFFLYMQTARPIIAADLGPTAAKGTVSSEGTRRWVAMPPQDKALWSQAYTENLRLYHARVAAYKNGNVDAKDMTEEEAAAYADEHNIDVPTADAQLNSENLSAPAAGAESEEAEEEAEEEEAKEPTPPPKATPKAKAGSSRKKGGAAAAAAAAEAEAAATEAAAAEESAPTASAIVPPAKATPVVKETPDKKRKRASTKKGKEPDDPVDSIEAQETLAVETPQSAAPKGGKKSRGKKAKVDA